MNVNDRGTKKWTAMMMPEHIKMIENLWKEDERKTKPIIDEQQKEEFDLMLHLALKDFLTVEVIYYADHDFHTVKDKLLKIDSLKKTIKFDHDGELNFDDIIDVTIL